MITRNIWNIFFLGELGPFNGGSSLLHEVGVFFPEKTWPFHQGKFIAPQGSYLFH
jgi:hypothetical protein